MEYFLKVSGLIIVFYLVYKTLLQKLTFYSINRWFLIAGIIVSFTFPLIVIPIYQEYTSLELPVTMFNNTQGMPITTEVQEPFDILDYVWILYASGVSFFAIRFLLRLLSLARVIKRDKKHKKDGFVFIETTAEQSPFSFFKWIVYNANQYNEIELSQIIAHEKVHAKQYHSIDILFVEISCIVLWFHPFIWLYNKSIKQNLEFLADKYAIHQIENRKSYQYTLLKASVSKHQMALSNHFYNSLIKKRIAMIQKSKSKKINLLKYALVIPVLTLFLMSFNTEEVYVKKTQEGDVFEIFIQKNTSDNELDNYITLFKNKFDKDLSFKDVQRNHNKTIKKITVEILFSDDSKFTTTQKHREGETAIRDFIVKYDPINKIIDAGDAERINHKESQKYSNDKSMIVIEKVEGSLSETVDKLVENTPGYGKGSNPLYVVDNFLQNRQTILHIPNHQVKAIAIIKKEFIEERYGKGAVESGVVQIVTTRSQNPLVQGVKIKKSAKTTLPKGVLYYVDKKQVSKKEFEKIKPDDIYKVDVLKGKSAIEKYGDKGKYDVVEIITKKDKGISVHFSDVKEVYGSDANKEVLYYNLNSNEVKLEKIPFPKGVLLYVDGKNVSKKEFEKIDPNNIYSISVLKDKQAIDKYGDKANNGVVEVITTGNEQIKTKSKNSLSKIKVIEYGKKRDTVHHTVNF
ncbi:M56 family metallopeptidase [Wenyingzhuangia sp. IMCC45467]